MLCKPNPPVIATCANDKATQFNVVAWNIFSRPFFLSHDGQFERQVPPAATAAAPPAVADLSSRKNSNSTPVLKIWPCSSSRARCFRKTFRGAWSISWPAWKGSQASQATSFFQGSWVKESGMLSN